MCLCVCCHLYRSPYSIRNDCRAICTSVCMYLPFSLTYECACLCHRQSFLCHVACHPCNISQWAMLNARHVYTRPTEYEWTNFPCLSSLLTVGCVHTQHIFYFHCSMLSDIIPYFLPFVILINNDRNKRWVGGWASVYACVCAVWYLLQG